MFTCTYTNNYIYKYNCLKTFWRIHNDELSELKHPLGQGQILSKICGGNVTGASISKILWGVQCNKDPNSWPNWQIYSKKKIVKKKKKKNRKEGFRKIRQCLGLEKYVNIIYKMYKIFVNIYKYNCFKTHFKE